MEGIDEHKTIPNMKNTIICSIAVLSAALLAACTETTRIWPEEGESKAYVEVSSQKVIFDADGGNAVITVATNADGWDYAAEGDWFTVARQDGNALLVETLINAGAETLTGKLTVSAEKNGETVSQEVALVQRAERSVNLSAEGTANCYIATSLNTAYSFDATVMGNGRTTTNLRPQPLRGAEARVLWETGKNRGAIVKSAEYTAGRIVFRTGLTYGNAVIGLFDASGNCIWSWHIWSQNYDPAATAQTYTSGAVFMDRNLGALETDYTQPASRGLYYQWGRKDPFPYPALATNAYIPAPTVYAAGFEYAESDPRNSGTESPYDVMTLEWAAAHPTTYMDGVSFEDWEEWTSVSDWLYIHHPNLWGNATANNSTIVRGGDKSVYDPCPPGWKVPGAEDFAGIERISVSAPYYVTIRYNGSQTTKIPLGGTFYEGRYDRNGSLGRLYTNAPYYLHWGSSTGVFYDTACTSILFDTSNYPPFINTTDFYRYAANSVRCIRE